MSIHSSDSSSTDATLVSSSPQIDTANYLNSDKIVEFNDVSLGYGARIILSGVNLSIHKGQLIALIGGSGSGKSTIMRGVTGQIRAKTGEVKLFGQVINDISKNELSDLRKNMGVLFQQGALFTDLNTFENVAYPLRELTKMNEEQIVERVLEKLSAVGLKAAAHLEISEVSGGMARRIALARAIVMEPELLLYDEPFAGLDPISMNQTANMLRAISKQLGTAGLLITHDIEESFRIVDYVYMLHQGAVIAEGTPDQIRVMDDRRVQNFIQGLPPEDGGRFEYPSTPDYESWYTDKQRQISRHKKSKDRER
ncbi:MAG: ATP-binding cassette domain-containing protein [Alcaligenaceae bacterium]|nr:ATP-binding cassette domain-containing protein [Alcaligenaceae bacterium]